MTISVVQPDDDFPFLGDDLNAANFFAAEPGVRDGPATWSSISNDCLFLGVLGALPTGSLSQLIF